jgi:hypothetical protein
MLILKSATCFGLGYRPSSGNRVHNNINMYTAKYYLRARKFTQRIFSPVILLQIKITHVEKLKKKKAIFFG